MSRTRTIFIPGSRLAEAAATAMTSTADGCCCNSEAAIDAPLEADAVTETAEAPPQASVASTDASTDAKSPVEVMQVIEGPK